MNNLLHNINTDLFDDDFYNCANLFIRYFGVLPNRICISGTDAEKACMIIEEGCAEKMKHTLSSTFIGQDSKKEEREQNYYVLDGQLVLEVGDHYCYIFYCSTSDLDMVDDLKARLKTIKRKARKKPLEINLIARTRNGMKLQGIEVKKTALDIDLYYNNDFMQVDETIRKRLSRKDDKGIVLLHGIPGTGKTTYLRYLVGKIKKRVLFVTPEIAGHMSDPELIQLLIDNPNSVLVIEDAENIIMQRQPGCDSAVSNLLNISDGLLSDFLNIQIICTFNSALSTVDEALLRKGRLIARYEFGKLSVHKAQVLSQQLGFDTVITQPMSVAEISNQHQNITPAQPARRLIGFRRGVELLQQSQ